MSDIRKLSPQEIEDRITSLDGWSIEDGKLYRRFTFTDFIEAFGFMASVAIIAQSMDHHPDWSNSYKTVDISLMTHQVSGLSKRDFELANKINERL